MDTFIKKPKEFKKNIEQIRSAGRPDVFNLEFLKSAGLGTDTAAEYTNLFKSLELVDSFGKPSTDYGLFISSEHDSRAVISEKIWKCYIKLFEEERHACKLDESELVGVFEKVYGYKYSTNNINLIVSTFKALVHYAGLSSTNETLTQELAIAGDHMNGNGTSKQNGSLTFDDLIGNRSVFPISEYEDERKHSVDFLIELIQDPPNINYRNNGSTKRTKPAASLIHNVLKRRYELLNRLGRFEEAIVALDQIIEFFENSNHKNKEEIISDYMIEKIGIYEQRGDDSRTLAIYEEFIERFYID
jgi:tetratricopeptide (TPR) repeat protein